MEYVIAALSGLPRARINDAFSSIANGIFDQLLK